MADVAPRHLPDGRTARVLELKGEGIAVRLTDLGATILSIVTRDRDGKNADVLVGPKWPWEHPAGGAAGPDARMGATCGRVANRIAGARYRLEGKMIPLVANEGRNQLHGGPDGFDKRLWTIEQVDSVSAALSLVSEDGDQGHPGRLAAKVTFAIESPATLSITYQAWCDRPTHVNLVSHPYFNLTGHSKTSVIEHELQIDAERYLPIDNAQIPTGEIAHVENTPFDFRLSRTIAEAIDATDSQLRCGDGYNHNFALAGGGMREVATLSDPLSGRRMRITTDQPGLQLYSGNALAEPYARRSAVCLETQGWPDAANHPDFPSTRLNPGATYTSTTCLAFDAAG